MSRTYRNYFRQLSTDARQLSTEPEKTPRHRKPERQKTRQELKKLATAGDPDAWADFGEE